MQELIFTVSVVLVVATMSTTHPQQASLDRELEPRSQQPSVQDNPLDYIRLFEVGKWKELLAQGKTKEVVDSIQRALGSKKVVEARTQWGDGIQDKEEVRNTVKWSAWKGNRSNLNFIVDSKVARRNDKIDFIGPNFGLSFQLKYTN